MVSVHGGPPVSWRREPLARRLGTRSRVRARGAGIEYKKGIRWMPWHQEAMKDVARCEKPWGAASRR